MNGMMNRIVALIIKEFLAILKDPRSRMIIIVPPLIQTLVFGYAVSFDLNRASYAILNEDGGQASRDFLAGFEGTTAFELVARLRDEREIAPLIDRRDALMVVHVRQDFTRNLLAGKPGSVQIIVDGRNSNTATVAVNYAFSIANSFTEQWNKSHGLPAPPARLDMRAWFNPNLLSRWFFIPGLIGLMTTVITVIITALSVAREREQGTFDQLLVTPFRPIEILIGKALPGFIIGLFEGTLILLIAILWFRVPFRGNVLLLYAGMGTFLLSTIGMGLMISSMASTMQQGLLGGFLLMVPAITLSGFATPIANMPVQFQYIALLNPLSYFLIIVRGVFLEQMPAAIVLHNMWPMALIGVVTMTCATWLFRHKMY